jgi:hypothetical protein
MRTFYFSGYGNFDYESVDKWDSGLDFNIHCEVNDRYARVRWGVNELVDGGIVFSCLEEGGSRTVQGVVTATDSASAASYLYDFMNRRFPVKGEPL